MLYLSFKITKLNIIFFQLTYQQIEDLWYSLSVIIYCKDPACRTVRPWALWSYVTYRTVLWLMLFLSKQCHVHCTIEKALVSFLYDCTVEKLYHNTVYFTFPCLLFIFNLRIEQSTLTRLISCFTSFNNSTVAGWNCAKTPKSNTCEK